MAHLIPVVARKLQLGANWQFDLRVGQKVVETGLTGGLLT